MSLRAYELAKQLGMPTKVLIDRCKEIDIVLHNNFTNIATGEAESIFRYITTGEKPLAPAAAEQPKAVAVATDQVKTDAGGPAAVAAPPAPEKDADDADLLAAAAAALEQATHLKPAADQQPSEEKVATATVPETAAPAVEEEGEVKPRFGVVRPAPDYITDSPELARVGKAEPDGRPARRGRGAPKRTPRFHKRTRKEPDQTKVVRPTSAEVGLPITVRSLSQAISIRTGDIVKKLMQQGLMATINDVLEPESAQVISMEFGCELKIKQSRGADDGLIKTDEPEDRAEDLVPRAPIVTFMGHVDHGKTSLLDAIRKTNVAGGEAGGITQHMGAYKVTRESKSVVFLDTPGHEAFTEMRARGANVTDIVVLVVAADDGVMPQTEEAIDHAKAAGVAVVVAVNKVDLPSANVQKVKQQLATLGLNPEEWGGTTGMVECSAVTGVGLDHLVERLGLEAEILDLKANPERDARGTVLEAHLSQGRGIVATVLVQNGTLHKGDVMLCSHGYGRAKILIDDKGREITEAGPSTPVEVVGLSEMPEAGDSFLVVGDLTEARKVAERRAAEHRAAGLSSRARVTLDNLAEHIQAGQVRELRLVIKADVQGSLEVLKKTLTDISGKDVRTNIIRAGIGGINESDVLLAEASDAVIIGFNVSTDGGARTLASDKGIDIRIYRIIYEVIDEVKKGVEGLLAPVKKEVVRGHLDVRAVFSISRIGSVAGCMMTDGSVTRSSKVRLLRDGKIVYDGTLAGLRRNKDDVREVREGFECGLKFSNFEDVKMGDRIEVYEIQETAGKLE